MINIQALEYEYIEKLKELYGKDKERAHIVGDHLIVELLKELGMDALSEAYDKLTDIWWYS